MKTEIHPEYVEAHVRCTCGNEFTTRSTQPEIHVEICSNCHPFYTGRQKLVDTGGRVERFQRRAPSAPAATRSSGQPAPAHHAAPAARRRASMAQRDAPVGGQAVLEGVMMRGVSTWAVAVRKPPPEQIADGTSSTRRGAPRRDRGRARSRSSRGQAPPGAALADHPRRRRAGRVARDRLQGARHLAPTRSSARGRGRRSAGHLGRHGRPRRRARRRPLLPRCPSGSRSLIKDDLRLGSLFVARREASCGSRSSSATSGCISRMKDLQRVFEYHGAEHKTISCYEAGLRAHARERPALLAPAPALRHELPAHRDDRGDLRLRPARHCPPGTAVRSRASSAIPLVAGLAFEVIKLVRPQPPQALGADR